MEAVGLMVQHESLVALVFAWRGLVYRVTGAAAAIAIVASLLMPNWYAATATCVPPREEDSRGSILRMFTRVGVDFGAAGLASGTPMSDFMVGILKSRRLRAAVVDSFDLVSVYSAETREHAIESLADHVRADYNSEGLIEVRVEDRDRQRAADMANAFVDLLDGYNRAASVEQAARTREFIESMLVENRARLDEAAEELRQFQESNRTIQLPEQTRVTVEAIARLESERLELEMQKGLLRDFSTEGSMEMRRIDARLREIDRKLAGLGGTRGGDEREEGALLPLSDIPALGLALADLTREVMVHETVYEFLSSQLEGARIQEARDLQSVTVLDRAVPPLKKSRPRRSIICILTVLLAFAASVGVVLFADALLSRAESDDLEARIGDSRESRALLGFLRWLRKWVGPGEEEPPSSPRIPR